MSDEQRYDALKDAGITIQEEDYEKIRSLDGGYDSLFTMSSKEIDRTLKAIGDKFKVFKTFYKNDIDIEFEFTKSGAVESLHKMREESFKQGTDVYKQYQNFISMMSSFDMVIDYRYSIYEWRLL